MTNVFQGLSLSRSMGRVRENPGNEVDSAIEVKDSQMKPETPNASHATPHFWREMRMKTLQSRQVDLSRLRRSRSAASRPRVRLIASLSGG